MKKLAVLFLCLCLVGCAKSPDEFSVNGVNIPLPEGWHGKDTVVAPDSDGFAADFFITVNNDQPIGESYYEDYIKDCAQEAAFTTEASEIIVVNGRQIAHAKGGSDTDQINVYFFCIKGYDVQAICYSDSDKYLKEFESILGEINGED